MFGKSEWFRPKNRGRGLYPKVWQGWCYALVWMGVIAGPFSTLAAFRLVPEAVIWLLASGGLFVWDVRLIGNGLRNERSPEEIEYDDESEHGESTLDTRGYQMRLRR